ncbi:MAG: hypothetical protein ACFFDT_37905 [Candidatus Hodarchaeota archaeon]
MQVKKQYQALVIGVMFIFAVGMYVGYQQGKASLYSVVGADPAGHVSVKVFRDGKVVYEYETHNLITTIGSTRVRDFLGWANASAQACQYISLSNDAAPDKAWTILLGEIMGSGLARASGTVSSVNVTAYQVTYTWTATAAVNVQCTGLHWVGASGSDGNLLAASSISSVSLQANDELEVTWTVNIPDG